MQTRMLVVAAVILLAGPFSPAVVHARGGDATQEQILEEMRKLREDRDSQRKEIDELRATVEELTRQLAAMKSGNASASSPEAAPLPAPPPLVADETIAPGPERRATVDPYGSLRIAFGSDSDGKTGMRDNVSRIGIRGAAEIREGVEVLATAELGMNIWGREREIIFGGDPGAPAGQVDNVLFARVGFLGFKGRAGQLTWGKQWSPYSEVAGMTDQAYLFGADAAGIYAAGTDGGTSGTGRADWATQYRWANETLSLGLQAQTRSKSENDRPWADTIQGALTWRVTDGFKVGVAWHEVRDGVPDPAPDQAKEGDQATVVAMAFERPRLYVGMTYADLENHERDDTGTFFSGRGIEVFSRYRLTDRWAVEGVFNDLEPDDSYDGQYRLRYFAGTFSYVYAKNSTIYAGYKADLTRAADGSDVRNDVFGMGINYSF